VLSSRAGIALQYLASQECLLRLFEVRSGEFDSNRQSHRQENPQDAAADCTSFPKSEQAGLQFRSSCGENLAAEVVNMLCARNAAWVALFEVFQEIHPKKLIPEKHWQALSFLIEALREANHQEDWAQIACAFDAINGNHKIATSEEWRKLYDALDTLWQDERINNVTPQEIEAHSGAFTRFRLFN
jgi:hypothetical protein